jgi:hypothetical protein
MKATRSLASTIVSASVLAGAIAVSVAQAFPDWSRPYTQSSSDCVGDHAIDPINFEFHGDSANVDGTNSNMHYHTDWDEHGGSDQWLSVKVDPGNYGCRVEQHQPATLDEIHVSDRFHIRLWNIPNSSGDGKKTVGDAHHEDFVITCGDAVDSNGSTGSGFDWGRRRLFNRFDAEGHPVDSAYWGNDRDFKQCDGDWAGSNGYGGRVTLGHTH